MGLISVINVTGQQINKEFSFSLFKEDFDNTQNNWPQTFTSENLILLQNGYYRTERKNSESGYFIFNETQDQYENFKVTVNFAFDGTNKSESAGLVLMAQADGNSSLLIEVNKKRQYRVMCASVGSLKPISPGKDGWNKFSSGFSKSACRIDVYTYQRVYDLFINGNFVQSFTEIELSKGRIGLFIGANSKVNFDNLYVSGEPGFQDLVDGKKNQISEEATLTGIIVLLKEKINWNEKMIDELNLKLKVCNQSH
jgi:hypothetical protein